MSTYNIKSSKLQNSILDIKNQIDQNIHLNKVGENNCDQHEDNNCEIATNTTHNDENNQLSMRIQKNANTIKTFCNKYFCSSKIVN